PGHARRSHCRGSAAVGCHRAIDRPVDGRSDRPGRDVRRSSTARAGFGWMTPVLLPVLNLAVALGLSALVVLLVGESPFRAWKLLTVGAFGSGEAIGYTLYYATTFVFTGLAVAVAFHGGLFNIGAEGQAYLGGLGVALVCLAAGAWPSLLVVPGAI